MTDEELAEQFADNINGLELTCSLVSAKDKSQAYRLGRYEGFLAGLKEGRQKWHDLRKDPNDLPKKNNPISSCAVLDQSGDRCWYNYEKKQWENRRCRTNGTYDCDIIAWCEIPKFEGVE